MSGSNPLVSVIVPTHNSERTLEACLVSVREQVYQPIELIIIDNESRDHTIEIAKRHAQIVETFGPERAAQRNRGAILSRGAYLLFVDSDMRLASHVIADCVKAAEKSGLPAVVIPESTIGGGYIARCRALERSFYVGDDQIEAARFVGREAFEQCGGFDEKLTGPEDWDLSRRVAAGRKLPRTASFISHDEGDVRLRSLLAKKRYYARSFLIYAKKHGVSTAAQGNLVLRPAILRNWRQLLRHPIIALGVVSIKTLETSAAGWGAIEAWLGEQSAR
jgi:glycosyltransferase involved in cell wall biosynthesis